MYFTHISFDGSSYQNIEPIAQIKLKDFNLYDNDDIIMGNYQGKLEYFYLKRIYSYDENFDTYQYISFLPIVNVEDFNECVKISRSCKIKMVSSFNYELYLKQEAIDEGSFIESSTTTTIPTTTISSTTVTTTPCPTGVLSRIYRIDMTDICAICVETNEFVCSSYANYNYDNCLNSVNSINQGNTDCTTTTTSTTLAPTTTIFPATTSPEPTSTTPIGPQG